jgi:VIT1/CCC1 family predicted Fe2+/Mn2+ transporter
MLVLFAMGAGKARIAHANPLRGGLEVVGIGLLAAIAGYLLGSLLPHVLGAPSVT